MNADSRAHPAGPQDSNPAQWEVYSLRYATQPPRPANEVFLEPPEGAQPHPFDYFFWILRRGLHCVVIDCGFGDDLAKARGRTLLAHPAEQMQALGITVDNVKALVLTHLHYDHAGRTHLFPASEIVVQAAELRHCTGPAMTDPTLRKHYVPAHIAMVVEAVFAGRVRFLEGDSEIEPGISLHLLPGHTPGQQVVRVETARGPLVLASDALHLSINLEKRNPFPIQENMDESYRVFDRLVALAGAQERIVPGHDRAFAENHPPYAGRPDVRCLHLEPTR